MGSPFKTSFIYVIDVRVFRAQTFKERYIERGKYPCMRLLKISYILSCFKIPKHAAHCLSQWVN